MKNRIRIKSLSPRKCKEIQGGGWGFDVGWFLGNTIAGNFLTPAGTSEALVDYAWHYLEKE